MAYNADVIYHDTHVEIRLVKHRLIFTRAQFDNAEKRGKAWSRSEKNEVRAQQRRAQHEADSLHFIE